MATIKQSSSHTVKVSSCVEFSSHADALGFFLVLMSDLALTKSEEIQDQLAKVISTHHRSDFICRALNSYYADNFKMIEIYLSL